MPALGLSERLFTLIVAVTDEPSPVQTAPTPESRFRERVIQAARDALRAALTHAVTEEEINKNVASLVKVPKPRRRRIKPWWKRAASKLTH